MNLRKQLKLVEIPDKFWETELNNDQEGMKHWKDLMDKAENESDKELLNPISLKTIFLAMMYAAREEGVELDAKYYELENLINEENDLSLTDMVDNIEHVYKFIKEEV
ncbi:hypothetical protein [Ferdinandcohnia sp. SAFN-114]|uniref:hypothetical protein n=1 Tax=Ferdinandcohnia sp. SAFN-114 TaxID=3387275 RepID=UPI003F7E20CB